MLYKNELNLQILSLSENEAFARSCVASFCLPLNPSLEVITDIKTAVSEAVTNCIVHAYKGVTDDNKKMIYISCVLFEGGIFKFVIRDKGCGIENLDKAMEPLYTTDPENERSGMGLPIMKTFSDTFKVSSVVGKGTTVTFTKRIN